MAYRYYLFNSFLAWATKPVSVAYAMVKFEIITYKVIPPIRMYNHMIMVRKI